MANSRTASAARAHHVGDLQVGDLHLQPAVLQPLQVQDVVDEGDEAHAVPLGERDHLARFVGEVSEHAARQQAQRPADGGQRRAQLVGHGGHELLLELLHHVSLGHVAHAAREVTAVRRLELEHRQLEGELFARLALAAPLRDAADGACEGLPHVRRTVAHALRDQDRQGAPDQLRRLVPEDARRGGVDGFDGGAFVDGDEAAQHVVDDGPRALLALAQGLLGQAALGDVAHAGHEALPARGRRHHDVHRDQPVRALGFRFHVPGRGGLQAGDEPCDVAADEVGQAASEQPFRGRVGRFDLPVVAEGDDGVGHGVHDGTDALLAGPQRAGDPLRALDGAAPRGGQRPDEAEDEEAAQAASDQDEETLAARRVGVEGGRGAQVQGQGTARHRHRALARQGPVVRARRAQGRRGVVEEGLGARRDPVVDLEIRFRGDGDGDGGDDVLHADRRIDPALQIGTPLLHRRRRAPPT